MKKVLLPIAALTLGLASVQAIAADGTVTFTGNITQSGCVVSNASSGNITVAMGTISGTGLTANGQYAGSKAFEIDLSKCATGAIKVRFDGTPVAGNSNVLKMTAQSTATTDPAATVGIQILDASSGAVYNIGDSSSAVPFKTIGNDGTVQLNMIARYYAFQAGTPSGPTKASTTFSIEYQ
ncbi:fimbrial protein [Tatumella sp. UBA2305]|uniref:fimbrial protein n=1 Tax=Tatumella sp. UBA2305 TaxID=1947647 RepID=UPI0025FFF4B3|nr:fimbrial protein [Tatumella sp. UBA2305]